MMAAALRVKGGYRTFLFALIGALLGFFIAYLRNPLPLGPREHVVPAQYRLSKIPGGTSLRMAMVHDVLHERYLRHGVAWYTQRNADARKIILQLSPATGALPSSEYLDAMDDLAVGLQQTGQTSESIAVLQNKLHLVSPLPTPPTTHPAYDVRAIPDPIDMDRRDLQRIVAAQNLSPLQHHQYTTFANLGTILILDALPKLLAGKSDSTLKSEMQESLNDIERAIAINPGGHFGRETWQAILTEHLIAAMDHPNVLRKYDMIGDVLDTGTQASEVWRYTLPRGMPSLSDSNISPEQRLNIRQSVDRLGCDSDWATLVNPDYTQSMPFDEPTLAIIGMWTLGAGPNPHFALAMGRIMESMGQNSIAWNAYERAVELQNGFWPDPAVCADFVSMCRDRQNHIAKLENPDDSIAWQDKMRAQHVKELAWGFAYQKAYRDFEASQIAAGVSLNDPNFYATFFQNRPPIASSPGLSDDAIVTHVEASTLSDMLPCLVLGIGIGLALARIIPTRILS